MRSAGRLRVYEDATALISPRLYRQYVLPIDRELSDRLPCVVFHRHGLALWTIDELVQLLGLRAIELNLESAACDIEGSWAD